MGLQVLTQHQSGSSGGCCPSNARLRTILLIVKVARNERSGRDGPIRAGLVLKEHFRFDQAVEPEVRWAHWCAWLTFDWMLGWTGSEVSASMCQEHFRCDRAVKWKWAKRIGVLRILSLDQPNKPKVSYVH